MLTKEQRAQALEFLAHHPVTVIATADQDATPGAAVILFAETPDLEIIFGTPPTRKYQNLKQNRKAALAFTKEWQSLQMHGTAVELAGAELANLRQLFIAKHPGHDRHMLGDSAFFKFTPSWIRYMDNSHTPRRFWEAET